MRQQGTFSVSNNILESHDDLIINTALAAESNNDGLYKLIIPKELKEEFLFRLRVLNITPASLLRGWTVLDNQ
jgi:hypothetical protein